MPVDRSKPDLWPGTEEPSLFQNIPLGKSVETVRTRLGSPYVFDESNYIGLKAPPNFFRRLTKHSTICNFECRGHSICSLLTLVVTSRYGLSRLSNFLCSPGIGVRRGKDYVIVQARILQSNPYNGLLRLGLKDALLRSFSYCLIDHHD